MQMERHSFFIPRPCSESYGDMKAAEGGRFCDRCRKSVLDFTGKSDGEIVQAVQSGGSVCARIEPERVSRMPFVAAVLANFPKNRLRFFLLAFLLAFGWEAWGISKAQAQRLEPSLETLRDPDGLRRAVRDTSEIVITGIVEDVYTREPVPFARVSVYQNGELIEGALTNAEGRFSISVERGRLSGSTYDLQLYHEGRIRWDSKIALDVREFKYLIDASLLLEDVAITERVAWEWGGYVVGELVVYPSIGGRPGFMLDGGSLYRPLDEWLMMHSSEIHHSGRW